MWTIEVYYYEVTEWNFCLARRSIHTDKLMESCKQSLLTNLSETDFEFEIKFMSCYPDRFDKKCKDLLEEAEQRNLQMKLDLW